jgi:hypothetical protein
MKIWHVISIAIIAASPSTTATAVTARNCSEAVLKCQIEGQKQPNIVEKCAAAGAQCMNTGVFVGPVTGRKWFFRNR